MAIVTEVTDRLTDFKTVSKFVTAQLDNTSGGIWEKFYSLTGTETTPSKPTDYSVWGSAVGAQFSLANAAKIYTDGYDSTLSKPGSDVISGKLQSDFLASALQAARLRYLSRIRASCSVQSRRRSLWNYDFDSFKTVFLDKWS